MTWTYRSVPWTVRREQHEDDGPYVSLMIGELAGFVAAARNDEELEALYRQGGASSLLCSLGD